METWKYTIIRNFIILCLCPFSEISHPPWLRARYVTVIGILLLWSIIWEIVNLLASLLDQMFFSVHRLIYERKTLRIDLINLCLFNLRIVKGKKPTQIKLQLFRKEWIWTFWWLVHQVNPLYDVLKLENSFKKHKDVTGKTLFSFILYSPFYLP